MSFFNKAKWFLGIVVIFGIVMATNLIDRNNFQRVNEAVVSIYEDRLVAKGLIFDMLQVIHQKEMAIATSDASFFQNNNQQLSKKLNDFVSAFEKTKLTTEELKTLNELKENLVILKISEKLFYDTKFTESAELKAQIQTVKINLNALSSIQLKEGRRQMTISKKAMDMIELFTNLEIYLLIFIAIAIQVIVMYNPKKRKEREEE
ncbi:MAG: MCP four helix bundle domain-containing protein [Flavobacterium sp.]